MSNASPFDSAYRKIARAKKHIASLKDELGEAIANSSNTIVMVNEEDDYTWIGSPINAIQAEDMATLVGDVIHNLRSALDVAAVAAVEASGGNSKDVYFPFAASAAELETQIVGKKFNRARAECVDLIRMLRPYRGEGGNEDLRALHDFDITDKHKTVERLSQLVLVPCMTLTLKDGSAYSIQQMQIAYKPGVEPGRRFAGLPDRPMWNPDYLPKVAHLPIVDLLFSQYHVWSNEPVIKALEELTTMVEEILEALRNIFI